jgi:hypothetical protein
VTPWLTIATCSDGPCKGPGFNYLVAGAVQSPQDDSCCDTAPGDPVNGVSTIIYTAVTAAAAATVAAAAAAAVAACYDMQRIVWRLMALLHPHAATFQSNHIHMVQCTDPFCCFVPTTSIVCYSFSTTLSRVPDIPMGLWPCGTPTHFSSSLALPNPVTGISRGTSASWQERCGEAAAASG